MRKKVLLIKLWAIGEVALSTPCVGRLKAELPEAEIYFLVGENAKDVVIGNPDIKRVIRVDENIFLKPHPIRLAALIKNLRKEKFDTIITLHHAAFFSLFAFLIGAPERLGLNLPGSWSLNTANIISDSTVDNRVFEYLKVLGLLSIFSAEDRIAKIRIFPTADDIRTASLLMKENGLKPKGFVMLSPTGGENPAASRFKSNIKNKVWPIEYYRELAGLVLENSDLKIVVVGARAEKARAEHIKGVNNPRVIDLTEKTNLRELVLLAEEAVASVTNDSGPMPVLSASRSPLIAIFGPTDPRLICPPSNTITVMKDQLHCSPCYDGSTFPNRIKDCEDAMCMKGITPERVFRKITEILKLTEEGDA